MPGYNHRADCGCGWCVKYSGSGIPDRSWYERPKFETYQSYTIPNARCPECGASVFFYQSEYGGKVFFESLGPPWPKHPCTIREHHSVGRCLILQAVPSEAPKWQIDGWKPLIISSVHREDEWWVVSAAIAETQEAVRFLVHGEPSIKGNAPAAFSGWNAKGETMLAYLEHGRQISSGSVIAFRYADHFQADPSLLAVELAARLLGAVR